MKRDVTLGQPWTATLCMGHEADDLFTGFTDAQSARDHLKCRKPVSAPGQRGIWPCARAQPPLQTKYQLAPVSSPGRCAPLQLKF